MENIALIAQVSCAPTGSRPEIGDLDSLDHPDVCAESQPCLTECQVRYWGRLVWTSIASPRLQGKPCSSTIIGDIRASPRLAEQMESFKSSAFSSSKQPHTFPAPSGYAGFCKSSTPIKFLKSTPGNFLARSGPVLSLVRS